MPFQLHPTERVRMTTTDLDCLLHLLFFRHGFRIYGKAQLAEPKERMQRGSHALDHILHGEDLSMVKRDVLIVLTLMLIQLRGFSDGSTIKSSMQRVDDMPN